MGIGITMIEPFHLPTSHTPTDQGDKEAHGQDSTDDGTRFIILTITQLQQQSGKDRDHHTVITSDTAQQQDTGSSYIHAGEKQQNHSQGNGQVTHEDDNPHTPKDGSHR